MINFDQFIHHNISTPDSFSLNDLNRLHVNISDEGDFQLHDIHVPFMLLLEIFNENEDFYNVFMLSQNTFHTLQTKNKLVYSPRPYSLHKHSCIEIMYVISGEVTNHVENQIYTYKAGQFCVMNKNIYHCDFQAIFFMLRDDFMLDLLKEYYDQNSGSSTPIEMNLIYHLIEDSQHSTRKFDKEYLD